MSPSLITFLLSSHLGGCGVSPLFNHAHALKAAVETAKARAQSSSCPLKFSGSGYCARLTWKNSPSDQGANSFELVFWDLKQGTSDGPYGDPPNSVSAKLWMPSMGHGSSPVTVVHVFDSKGKARAGTYQASDVYFIMPGQWDIHVLLKEGTKVVDDASLSLAI